MVYDKWSEGIIAVSNTDVLDDWLRVTDKSDRELINKLTQTVSKWNTLPDNNEFVSGLEPNLIIDIKPPAKGTRTCSKFTYLGYGLNAWVKPSAILVCSEHVRGDLLNDRSGIKYDAREKNSPLIKRAVI